MLKIDVTGDCMVFAKDYNGKTLYSVGLSKKKQDGTYENFYIGVSFKKGVELANKTKINVTRGWLDPYKTKEGKDGYKLFIMEFEIEGVTYEGFTQIEESDICPF